MNFIWCRISKHLNFCGLVWCWHPHQIRYCDGHWHFHCKCTTVFSFHLHMLGSRQESYLCCLFTLFTDLLVWTTNNASHENWLESKSSTLFFQHHLGTQKLYSLTLLLHVFSQLCLALVAHSACSQPPALVWKPILFFVVPSVCEKVCSCQGCIGWAPNTWGVCCEGGASFVLRTILGYYTIRCCWCRNCCLQLPHKMESFLIFGL